jgi:hypothetical protein
MQTGRPKVLPNLVARAMALLGLSVLVVACGGGGGSAPPPVSTVTVSGTAIFDLVPHDPFTGALDFAATTGEPIRGATVQAVDGGGRIRASGVTGPGGDYSLRLPANTQFRIRVLAERRRTGTPGWDTRVVDNTTSGSPTYAIETPLFSTGSAGATRDIRASSGWTGTAYTEPRFAAPFALLDSVREAEALVLEVEPATVFPELTLAWSVFNTPSSTFQPSTGRIISTFYDRDFGARIWVLGDAGVDTDEYDRDVIIHEWSHFHEEQFSRVDSPGGQHSRTARHDARVAFSEGWGNAFAVMAQGDPVYEDTARPGSSSSIFRFTVGNPSPVPGWYSEISVERILWNLYDADNAGLDTLSLGYGPIDAVRRGPLRTTRALKTIYPFIEALKDARPADAAAINALVEAEDIVSTGQDIWGSLETNDAGREHVLPLYEQVFVGGPAVNVCSVANSTIDTFNRIGNRRFLRFSAASAGTFELRAQGAVGTDPDLVAWNGGIDVTAESRIDGVESLEIELPAGEHVIEIYDYRNIRPGATDVPGTYCFDVTVRRLL